MLKKNKKWVVTSFLSLVLCSSALVGCRDVHTSTSEKTHEHTLTYVAAVKPDCEHDGHREYWVCSGGDCDRKLFSDPNGQMEVTISDVTIPGGHIIESHPAKEPTYTEEGNIAYYTCSRCGKYFTDAEGKTEISKDDIIISKLTASINIEAAQGVIVSIVDNEMLDKKYTYGDSIVFTVDVGAYYRLDSVTYGEETVTANAETGAYMIVFNGNAIVVNTTLIKGDAIVNVSASTPNVNLNGMNVSVVDKEDKEVATKTIEDGQFTLSQLELGKYSFKSTVFGTVAFDFGEIEITKKNETFSVQNTAKITDGYAGDPYPQYLKMDLSKNTMTFFNTTAFREPFTIDGQNFKAGEFYMSMVVKADESFVSKNNDSGAGLYFYESFYESSKDPMGIFFISRASSIHMRIPNNPTNPIGNEYQNAIIADGLYFAVYLDQAKVMHVYLGTSQENLTEHRTISNFNRDTVDRIGFTSQADLRKEDGDTTTAMLTFRDVNVSTTARPAVSITKNPASNGSYTGYAGKRI